MATIMRAVALSKQYTVGGVVTEALKQFSLELEEGSILAVMGSSGSGKSTLLHILGGLERPDEGQVYVSDMENAVVFKEPEITDYRKNHIGIVFQKFNLIKDLNVRDNLEIPLLIRKEAPHEVRKKVAQAAKIVGLSGKLLNKPWELSGGQQQRVAIARAIISRPEILLADEPTGALDYNTALEILDLLRVTNDELGKSMILVTHDPMVASRADRVIFLHDGMQKAEYQNKKGIDNVREILDVFRSLAVEKGGQ